MSKLLLRALMGICALFVLSPVQAQDARGVVNLLRGFMGAAILQNVRAEWSRLAPAELECIQTGVARRGTSIDQLIQGGIEPNDPRISLIRSACKAILLRQLQTNVECQINTPAGQLTSFCDEYYARGLGQNNYQKISRSDAIDDAQSGHSLVTGLFEREDAQSRREQMQAIAPNSTKVPSPNFNCAKAKTPTELTVCRSYALSSLDAEYGELYRRSTSIDHVGYLKQEIYKSWANGKACNGEFTCVEVNLNHGITVLADYLRKNGQSVQTNAERLQNEKKAAEEAAAARRTQELQEAKAIADQAAADHAQQEADRIRVQTEQNIAMEKFHAEQARKAAEAELQRKKEQSEIEFRDLVHKTLGFAFPISGCVLLITIFLVAIRRRIKQAADSEGMERNG